MSDSRINFNRIFKERFDAGRVFCFKSFASSTYVSTETHHKTKSILNLFLERTVENLLTIKQDHEKREKFIIFCRRFDLLQDLLKVNCDVKVYWDAIK